MSFKPVFLNQFKHNTLSGVLFIGVIMDEKAKKRLIHIRDATKVNKQHAEDYKRKWKQNFTITEVLIIVNTLGGDEWHILNGLTNTRN